MRLGLLLMLTGAGASDRLYKAAWPAITEAYFRKVLDESGGPSSRTSADTG